jgi:hypothetical protein
MLLEEVSELKTIEVLKPIIGINIIAQWEKNERTFSG